MYSRRRRTGAEGSAEPSAISADTTTKNTAGAMWFEEKNGEEGQDS